MDAVGLHKSNGGKLVAVVTTHNRLDQIQRTVAQLLAEGCDDIIVVDNASVDGTQLWLSEHPSPHVHAILSEENLGGAGGFEVGLKVAIADHAPDWVVVMDDDARPIKGAIDVFRAADKSSWSAIAAAVYYPNGDICEMNRPSKNPFWHLASFVKTFWNGRSGFHISNARYKQSDVIPIDSSSFVGMFISAKALREFGFPDGKLFIYGDDVLYSLKLRKAGGTLGFNPNIRFEHDCSTFEGASRVYKPYWKIYYNYRNGLIMYRAAAGLMFPAVLMIILPKWIHQGHLYKADRPTFNRLLRRALVDGIFQRTSITHDEVLALSQTSKGRRSP